MILVTLFQVVCLMSFKVDAKLIDLSHVHGPNTFMTPGNRAYNRTQMFRGEVFPGIMAEMGEYVTGEHGGTHVDAPNHVGVGNATLEQISLENTVAEGVMIDCSVEASKDRKYLVTVPKILDWEKEHGRIPSHAAVIFNFDWSKWFHNKTLYVHSEEPAMHTFTFPAVSKEAGLFLYIERQIKIIGTDTMSPDPVSSNGQHVTSLPIHELYLPNNVLIVESLKGTEQLPPRGFRFHATPVKYLGASGAQVRAYAMIYEGFSNGVKNEETLYWMVTALAMLNTYITFWRC